jgi:predicted DNA-binding transcriptional regulator YafY
LSQADGYRTLQQLSFEPDELAAVVDAAARVRQLGDPLLAEHAESALRKLAADLPVDATATAPTQLVPPRARASPEVLAILGQALERRKQVTFDYHTMGRDSSTRRTVEPFGLFFLNQHWYLVARTPGEEEVKNYRLNRIAELTVNPSRPGTADYDIPSTFSLRDHARSRQAWELGAGDVVDALVHFRVPTGAAAAALRLGEQVDGHPENRRFRVRRTDAFARWLLSFGGDIVPVSPRDLVDEFHGLVRETLAHHSASPPPRPSPGSGQAFPASPP